MLLLRWWIFISIIALVIDDFTSNLFFICFTAGGLVAILVNLLGFSPMFQAIMFCIASIASILFIIPYVKKHYKKGMGEVVPLEDRYIGKEIELEQDIHDSTTMQVQGIYWTIKNVGSPMKKGEWAIIVGVEGNKLLVKKKSEEE